MIHRRNPPLFHGRNHGRLRPWALPVVSLVDSHCQDHLVALAIAKKRRDDLKRKADEAPKNPWTQIIQIFFIYGDMGLIRELIGINGDELGCP